MLLLHTWLIYLCYYLDNFKNKFNLLYFLGGIVIQVSMILVLSMSSGLFFFYIIFRFSEIWIHDDDRVLLFVGCFFS